MKNEDIKKRTDEALANLITTLEQGKSESMKRTCRRWRGSTAIAGGMFF
jgi:hypothetical protein